ncbi:hypothetical protein GLAREA_04513 [Glarea lozoyensis ATCC 20868]|uniref:Uncharacterized protein n=1 Tax=Glarea lozoyensis (strain ATCC 20868 / MF5171) TaxID=1116229 RepID=S3CMJ4_GLAL2|nr:uncharacterized protein GLAREA_04513 [Glarea lozoyensis ATCC 20868]EPE27722.1 hypothetical protein GLAREA_04513 [Glarea lozoyensis ATCC 20868]
MSLDSPRYELSNFPNTSQDEKRIFHNFANFSVSSIAGQFSSPFWERRVLQISLSESCVRNAVVAIGALHENFNKQSLLTTGHQDSQSCTFALRHHAMATRDLARLLSASQQWDLALTACILFVCFENFLGNHQASLTHLRAGLHILRCIHEAGTTLSESWKKEFSPLLMRLGIQACLFLDPREDGQRAALWEDLQIAVPENPLISFKTIEDGLWSLSSIGAGMICDRGQTQVAPTLEIREKHRAHLNIWEQSLREFLSNADTHDPVIDSTLRGAATLKIFQILICITGELYERSETHLEEMLIYCESVDSGQLTYHGSPRPMCNFSTDLGTIAPVFFVALKSHNPVTQTRAWKLLKRSHRREGMWDSEICAGIVENSMAAFPLSNKGDHKLDEILLAGRLINEEDVLRPKNSIWVT